MLEEYIKAKLFVKVTHNDKKNMRINFKPDKGHLSSSQKNKEIREYLNTSFTISDINSVLDRSTGKDLTLNYGLYFRDKNTVKNVMSCLFEYEVDKAVCERTFCFRLFSTQNKQPKKAESTITNESFFKEDSCQGDININKQSPKSKLFDSDSEFNFSQQSNLFDNDSNRSYKEDVSLAELSDINKSFTGFSQEAEVKDKPSTSSFMFPTEHERKHAEPSLSSS